MKRILVVEDEDDICNAIRDILMDEGHEAEGVASAEAALSRCAAADYDIILLDIRMPGMDGIELARRLRAEEKTQSIPLVFCSVLDHVESILDGFDVGGNAYVLKPVNRDGILDVIRIIEEESATPREEIHNVARGSVSVLGET